MFANLNHHVKSLYILVALLMCSYGCHFEEITTRHSTYASAVDGNILRKGWIPEEIVFDSMTDIFLRTNPSTNEAIFYFKLSERHMLDLENILERDTIQTELKTRINTPRWWKRGIKEKMENRYKYKDNTAVVYFYLNKDQKEIFGWR